MTKFTLSWHLGRLFIVVSAVSLAHDMAHRAESRSTSLERHVNVRILCGILLSVLEMATHLQVRVHMASATMSPNRGNKHVINPNR